MFSKLLQNNRLKVLEIIDIYCDSFKAIGSNININEQTFKQLEEIKVCVYIDSITDDFKQKFVNFM